MFLIQLTIFIVLVILCILTVRMIKFIDKVKSQLPANGGQSVISLSRNAIFFLCFGEGYVIFTDSKKDAISLCQKQGLNPNVYWSSINIIYDNPAEANKALLEVKNMLGPSMPYFIKTQVMGIKLKVSYFGYITTK